MKTILFLEGNFSHTPWKWNVKNKTKPHVSVTWEKISLIRDIRNDVMEFYLRIFFFTWCSAAFSSSSTWKRGISHVASPVVKTLHVRFICKATHSPLSVHLCAVTPLSLLSPTPSRQRHTLPTSINSLQHSQTRTRAHTPQSLHPATVYFTQSARMHDCTLVCLQFINRNSTNTTSRTPSWKGYYNWETDAGGDSERSRLDVRNDVCLCVSALLCVCASVCVCV